MKKILTLAFALIAAFSPAQNRSIEFEHGTFAELLAKAKKENKMIYIDCYTVWCGPCKWLAKNIFTNDTVADFYNKNFINAKIDMEKGEGIEIAKKYNVQGYPTMLYLNSDGEQLHRTCGAGAAKVFIGSGQDALSPDTQLKTYTANFGTGKVDAAFATKYFYMLDNACQSYGKAVNDYFATVKAEDLRSRGNWKVIYKFVDDYNSPVFKSFEADREYYSMTFSRDSVEEKINKVYISGLYSAAQNNDLKVYEDLKEKLKATKTKNAGKIILEADIKLYQRSGDWLKYASLCDEFVTKYASSDAGDLNSFAWAFYEHIDDKAMLQKAEAWSKKATEIDNNYAYNDTYAAVLFKLGKKAEAKAAATTAIEIAKKTGEDHVETLTLLEKINALK